MPFASAVATRVGGGSGLSQSKTKGFWAWSQRTDGTFGRDDENRVIAKNPDERAMCYSLL